MTITTSLAVLKTLEMAVERLEKLARCDNRVVKNNNGFKLKWPNDVLIDGKKISGILSEMSADMDHIKYVVVGIGINVNQDYFPDDIGQRATSLKIEYQQTIERRRLLIDLLGSLDEYYYLLLAGKEKILLEIWKEKLGIIGEEVAIYSSDNVYYGRVLDISDQGELILKDDKNISHKFWAGDVSLRKNSTK